MTDDELFLTAILNCSCSDLYTHPRQLTSQQAAALDDMRRRRAAGEPVQYITGFTEFFGYRFEVGPGVLVPRPETEVLAERVIAALKAQGKKEYTLLDLGTGSGCLAVTLARELPCAHVTAVDISPEALAYARRNAAINSVEDKIQFVESDMALFLRKASERFDAIVSNPPYIPSGAMAQLPADVRHEPALALEAGTDGLSFYKSLIPGACKVLCPGGILAVEFGDGQAKDLQNLFVTAGSWDKIQTMNDNAGRPRIIMAALPR